MPSGRIMKALSGFYYVRTETGLLVCRARGKFRLDGTSPLVGDLVRVEPTEPGKGCPAATALSAPPWPTWTPWCCWPPTSTR